MTAAEDVDAAVTFATWARLQGLRGDEPEVAGMMGAWFAVYLFGQCLREPLAFSPAEDHRGRENGSDNQQAVHEHGKTPS